MFRPETLIAPVSVFVFGVRPPSMVACQQRCAVTARAHE
jgi:hypothetical protein